MFSEKALIVFISRGLLTSLTDARDVLQVIAKANGKLHHQVAINTYVVIEGKAAAWIMSSRMCQISNMVSPFCCVFALYCKD